MNKLLEVKDLYITFQDIGGEVEAVSDLNFYIEKGEILGLVGESGSGKSVTGKAIMGILENGKISGKVEYCGEDILHMKEAEICKIRGEKISMIFQEPMTALNPVMKIGKQIEEVFQIHKKGNKEENRRTIVETLKMLNIENPEELMEKYPFELSGGLRQRVVIAMAVISRPELIIADEPTTALDVTTQMEILILLKRIAVHMGSAILLITHDMGVIAECADRVIVMYRGKKMEDCEVNEFFHKAVHPYSQGLMAASPSNFEGRYHMIRGNVAQSHGRILCCPFKERCDYYVPECERMPEERQINKKHTVACWKVQGER